MDDPGAGALASPIIELLEGLHRRYRDLRDGQVATYIPELAKADPAWFGIAIATADGHVYEVGDTRQLFTIQSISKPFTYGLAIEDRGHAAVLAKIGVEPTGDAFNSISLAAGTGCPLNPMINAGAIAAASLVAGASLDDRLHRLLSVYSLYAGRQLTIDEAVFISERTTGHRNRAIGHMLRNFDIIGDDPTPALDLYFQQCSVAVDCRDIAMMGATLANGGTNPVTGERAVRASVVEHMLSVMTTCGMYDYAGEWVYWVGLPAKSGVGGGVLAVLPGQLGIGVFSPPLDARGNSVRGIAVCQDLSRELNLHLMRVPRAARSAIRAHYTVARVRSKRRRPPREQAVLDAVGGRAAVYEVQGDLTFPAVEALVRRVVSRAASTDVVVIECARVTSVDEAATGIILTLLRNAAAAGTHLVLAGVRPPSRFLRTLEERLAASDERTRLRVFPDLDQALEWTEGRLLDTHGAPVASDETVPLSEHDVCAGLTPGEVAALEQQLRRTEFPQGHVIVRKGETADELYLLTRGRVSVTLDLPNGQVKRLATLSAGMAFGDLAVVNRGPRSADVRADTPVACYALSLATFDAMTDTHPRIKITMLQNLFRNVAQMLTRANAEIAALAD